MCLCERLKNVLANVQTQLLDMSEIQKLTNETTQTLLESHRLSYLKLCTTIQSTRQQKQMMMQNKTKIIKKCVMSHTLCNKHFNLFKS